MTTSIRVVITNDPPSDEQLKAENAVIVHSLYEAAEIIAHQQLCESLQGLGVQVVFEPMGTHRLRVDEVYYQLITKKPVLALDLLKVDIHQPIEQLDLRF